ncbi:MAG: hypothetical protein Q8P67_15105 [archaeon]|nr:hypothetical protein [archaeon]
MTESQRRLNVKNRVQQRKQRQQQQQQQTDLEATSEEVSQESVQQKLAEIEALLGGVDPAPEAPTDSSAPPLPSTPSSGDLLSKLASIEQQLALVASDSDDEGDGEDDDGEGEGEGEDEECNNNNDNDSNVEDQSSPPVSSADLLDRLASIESALAIVDAGSSASTDMSHRHQQESTLEDQSILDAEAAIALEEQRLAASQQEAQEVEAAAEQARQEAEAAAAAEAEAAEAAAEAAAAEQARLEAAAAEQARQEAEAAAAAEVEAAEAAAEQARQEAAAVEAEAAAAERARLEAAAAVARNARSNADHGEASGAIKVAPLKSSRLKALASVFEQGTQSATEPTRPAVAVRSTTQALPRQAFPSEPVPAPKAASIDAVPQARSTVDEEPIIVPSEGNIGSIRARFEGSRSTDAPPPKPGATRLNSIRSRFETSGAATLSSPSSPSSTTSSSSASPVVPIKPLISNIRAQFEKASSQAPAAAVLTRSPSSSGRPAADGPKRRWGPSKTDNCSVCRGVVYLTEKLVADDKIYHTKCFTCGHCHRGLKLGNYASLEGSLYCKPHFKQLFATKGNYDEGFGVKKLTQRWAEQKSSSGGSTAPFSAPRAPAHTISHSAGSASTATATPAAAATTVVSPRDSQAPPGGHAARLRAIFEGNP